MTDSSEEEMEELFSEQLSRPDATQIYLKSQPKTESFDKFVLDEVMIARSMMKKASNSLSSLNEKQRQRALKLRDGITARTSGAVQLSLATKPNEIGGNEDITVKNIGWCNPEVIKVSNVNTDRPSTSICKEGTQTEAKTTGGDVAARKEDPIKSKSTQVNFDLEGWSVPPISSSITPFGMINQAHTFGGDGASPKCTERESKKTCRVSDSNGRRRGRAMPMSQAVPEVVGNYFPLEETATHKAHAISSKPIEESVFQSVDAKYKQGVSNRLNRTDQMTFVLESKGKKLDGQYSQKWNPDDFSVIPIDAGKKFFLFVLSFQETCITCRGEK